MENYNINNLISIFDNITMISISNNLFIKDKVKKKIDLIKRLSTTDIDILNYNNNKKEGLFNYLDSINTKFTTIKKNYNHLNNKLNSILGEIIHNAYLTSGYQILISNMPELASQSSQASQSSLYNNNNIIIVDEEAIYDTIEMYVGKNTVLSIIKIDTNTYLAKLKDINDARYLCSIIHKMQVETNIIRVEMLENLENCFNDEQITIEKNNSNNIDNNIDSNSDSDSNINTTDDDISDYGYTNINIKKKTKTLIETYFELIYNKINYFLSYFWKK
jgi:hypothetical protein